MIRIDTSGWSYDHWVGVLFPERTPVSARLARYVHEFDTVELNASFYHDFHAQELQLRTNTEMTGQIHLLTTELHRHILGRSAPTTILHGSGEIRHHDVRSATASRGNGDTAVAADYTSRLRNASITRACSVALVTSSTWPPSCTYSVALGGYAVARLPVRSSAMSTSMSS